MATSASSSLLMINPDDPGFDLNNTKQLGFMARLPSDIIFKVFSFLDKRDCLNSMSVCRVWYFVIPQYARSIWMTLCLRKKDIYTENQCVIRCLGDHVKFVTLDNLGSEKDVYNIMYKLLDWGCTKVKSLELNECQTEDQDALLSALVKFAPRLTHLKMLNHGSNIAFLHVLNACPQLTRFTYQSKIDFSEDAGVIDKEPMVLGPIPSVGTFPNITHLCIDAMLDTETLLKPILQRCPNLKSFAGTSFARADLEISEAFPRYVVNYDLLFDWCPKLTHIYGSLSYVYLNELINHSDSNDQDDSTGLQNFKVADAYQQNGILRLLTKGQATLETLSVNPILAYETAFSWPAILTSLQFTKLKTFDFRRIQFDASSIIDILNRCPALENLCLESRGLILNPATICFLRPMRQLRYFSWSEILFTGDLSLVTLLGRFPALESLVMRYLTVPPTFPDDCECPKHLQELCLRDIQWTHDSNDDDRNEAPIRLFEWFATHSKVNRIALSGIENFSSRTLPTIATISSLKDLEVDLEETQCGGSEEANLYQFATSLGKTAAIEAIYIETWWHIPTPTVMKLKELPHMKDLVAYHRWEDHHCSACSLRHEEYSP